ncbi:MAG: Asp-tRNA(Asn)/Glu-tRNA(Gln) amidotransferase subunit GatB, partial [Proteobacteria bacterium]|nr:Asp-tRNA(Asn)/Glu-tRNA(Gln) amidotransferase subunit GatB [Pseudomonadota bacterium]
MITWEIVVGLETHTQLKTQSKMFSPAPTTFGAQPNTQAHPIDLALPGVLPTPNLGAIDCAIRFGLAVGGKIARRSVFARKNYFYPDLPKGYQISQFELPVVEGGSLSFSLPDGSERTVQLTRAHLEEDAGKSIHEGLAGLAPQTSGIDLNRAGTPLLEIVTEPVMRSAQEAAAYARALHGLVTWMDICDGNLQEGSFRCDANVSVRPKGSDAFGTRCEIKNINSFRFLERAIEYEAARQIELIESGGQVRQETRLFDPDRDETRPMRSKEDAHDYRYFPDPDLPTLFIDEKTIDQVRQSMPVLPEQARAKLVEQFSLSVQDAGLITSGRDALLYFEQTLAALSSLCSLSADKAAKLVVNWMAADLSTFLNRSEGLGYAQAPVTPLRLASLLQRLEDGTISSKMARDLFGQLWQDPQQTVDGLIESQGLHQVQDTGQIDGWVEEVIAANPKMVEEFKAG